MPMETARTAVERMLFRCPADFLTQHGQGVPKAVRIAIRQPHPTRQRLSGRLLFPVRPRVSADDPRAHRAELGTRTS
jgi:hypothetical protein